MNDFAYIQALNVELGPNDADASDVRCYLASLLEAVLIEEEGFSGKRPFGNSGWQNEITEPLMKAGYDPFEAGFFTGLVNALCQVEEA